MPTLIQKISIFMMSVVMGAMPLVFFATPAIAAVQPILVHAPAVNSPATSGTSFNWSGYQSTGGSYTGVGGTWSLPSVSSSSSLTADATWVGIGGVSSRDLIQVGTQAVTGNGADQVQYQAWYETLPATTQQIPLTVNAGDSVTASVMQIASGEWQVSFHDNTTGGQYSTEIDYASSLSSAEWIEEAPSDQDGIMPLDQFGALPFSGAYTIMNGTQENLAGASAIPLYMTNDFGQAVAVPSALNSDQASFTVSRTSATPSSAGSGYSAYGRGRRVGVGVQGYSSRRGNNGGATTTAPYGTPAPVPVSPPSPGNPATSSLGARTGNFGRGQFRFFFGGGFNQRQLIQLFREQFERGFDQ